MVEGEAKQVKYIINYSGSDKSVELPDDALLELDSIKAGDKDSSITVLNVYVGDKLHAAFVGAMTFYPETMEPKAKTWAR